MQCLLVVLSAIVAVAMAGKNLSTFNNTLHWRVQSGVLGARVPFSVRFFQFYAVFEKKWPKLIRHCSNGGFCNYLHLFYVVSQNKKQNDQRLWKKIGKSLTRANYFLCVFKKLLCGHVDIISYLC